jgi:hypothetical protein
VSDPDLNISDLPPLTDQHPRYADQTRQTVRNLFGCDGMFFTVPGTFPTGLPDHIGFLDTVYALLHTPEPATGTVLFIVRDADGNRHRLGHPAADSDTAVRSALFALADQRRAHARQVEHNRVHLLGLEPHPPVRIGHHNGAWIVHARCSCPYVEGLAAHFERVSLAADAWLNEDATTPWAFCPTSASRLTAGSVSGHITATGRADQGAATAEIERADGHRTIVRLDEVTD